MKLLFLFLLLLVEQLVLNEAIVRSDAVSTALHVHTTTTYSKSAISHF